MYVSWKLIPAVVPCPFVTIQDMALSILKQFSPSQLSSPSHLGTTFSNRPLEARYQFEFYRGLFAATSGGGVRISPELLTMTGTSEGCIDFFVPQKKWGIKATQGGLGFSGACMDLGNKYRMWLTSNDMADYIVLDCRTDTPKLSHPSKMSFCPSNHPSMINASFQIYKTFSMPCSRTNSAALLSSTICLRRLRSRLHWRVGEIRFHSTFRI